MADIDEQSCSIKEAVKTDLEMLKNILWGSDIKHDLFRRWTQGKIILHDIQLVFL